MLLFDLGFVLGAGSRRGCLSDLGVRLEQQVVVDPLSHYQSDPEMVAVTGYDPHPITRTLSLTFFPGIRPLTLTQPAAGVRGHAAPRRAAATATPVRCAPAEARTIESPPPRPAAAGRAPGRDVRPRVLGIAAEGTLDAGRAAVAGRGDRRRRLRQQLLPSVHGEQRPAAVGGPLAGARGARHRRPHPHPRAADDPADGRAKPVALHLHRRPAAARRDRRSAAWSGGGGDERGSSLRRLALPLLAMLALAYLAAMVVTGAQPVQRQLVKFEAKGVLQIEPEAVQRITLGRGDRQLVLARSGDGWALDPGGAVEGAAATHLDTAVKMLHRSPPVREIAAEELSGVDTRPFGLEEPVVVATLSGPGGKGLTVRFGALNPEGFLQYMRIDGDPKVYLMSRFIGAEWTAALEGLKAR